MDNEEWFQQLRHFLSPHPILHPDAGEIYTPKENYEISFLFNGVPPISGKHEDLEINFNSDTFIIFSTGNVISRILWSSFIGFELTSTPPDATKKAKLYIVPKPKT